MSTDKPSFIALESKLPPDAKSVLQRLDTLNIPVAEKEVILDDLGHLFTYKEDGRAAYGYLLYTEDKLSGLYAT